MTSPHALPYVCISDDWGRHNSTTQQLMRAASKVSPVVWVNSLAMRRPQLSIGDVQRLVHKVAAPRQAPAANDGSVTVIAPLVVPLHGWGPADKVNRALMRRVANHVREAAGGSVGPTIVSNPIGLPIARELRAAPLIYYCLDDWETLPGVDWHMVSRFESDLLEEADIVLAVSPELANVPRLRARSPIVLPQGVDVARFRAARRCDDPGARHRLGVGRAPTVGFTGTFDDRMDPGYLDAVLAHTDASLLLVGDAPSLPAHLRDDPRVTQIDYVPYEEVPTYLSLCDVLIAPYLQQSLNDSLAPLKLLEYISTGKPVVASRIPATSRLSDRLAVADSQEAFGLSVASALSEAPVPELEVEAFLAAHSWDARVDTIRDLVTRFEIEKGVMP